MQKNHKNQAKLSLSILLHMIQHNFYTDVEIDDNIICTIENLKERYQEVKQVTNLNNIFAYYKNFLLEIDQPFRTLIKRHNMDSSSRIKIQIFNQRQKNLENQILIDKKGKQQVSKKNLYNAPLKQHLNFQQSKQRDLIQFNKWNSIPKSSLESHYQSKNGNQQGEESNKQGERSIQQKFSDPFSQNQQIKKRVVVNKWVQSIFPDQKKGIQKNKAKIRSIKKNQDKIQEMPESENEIQYKVLIKINDLNNHQLLDVKGLSKRNTLQDAIQKIKANIQDYQDTQFTYALGQNRINKQSLKQMLSKFSANKKIYDGKQFFEVQLTMLAKYPGG